MNAICIKSYDILLLYIQLTLKKKYRFKHFDLIETRSAIIWYFNILIENFSINLTTEFVMIIKLTFILKWCKRDEFHLESSKQNIFFAMFQISWIILVFSVRALFYVLNKRRGFLCVLFWLFKIKWNQVIEEILNTFFFISLKFSIYGGKNWFDDDNQNTK